jgi:hypothetical protein
MSAEDHEERMRVARELQAGFRGPKQETRGRRGTGCRVSLYASCGRVGGQPVSSSFANRAVNAQVRHRGSIGTSTSPGISSSSLTSPPTPGKRPNTSEKAHNKDQDNVPTPQLRSGEYAYHPMLLVC